MCDQRAVAVNHEAPDVTALRRGRSPPPAHKSHSGCCQGHYRLAVLIFVSVTTPFPPSLNFNLAPSVPQEFSNLIAQKKIGK